MSSLAKGLLLGVFTNLQDLARIDMVYIKNVLALVRAAKMFFLSVGVMLTSPFSRFDSI